MGFHFSRIVGSSSLIALILSGAVAWGEAPAAGKRAVADPQSSPRLQKVFKLPTPDLESGNAAPVIQNSLQPVLRMAMDGYKQVQSNIRDYSCILVRRERVDGRLGPHEFIFAKVRHRMVDGDRTVVPFSVYLKFLKPTSVAGREVLFVEGRNDGEMFARRGGTRFAFVTTKIHPESELAMRGNRYPITEVGIENLLYRLIESAQAAGDSPCEVKYLPKAKINGRMALGIVVTHKVRKEDQPFYQARIFVDDDLQVPLHYESFDWPTDSSNELPLLEQYTYTKLQLNPGFTDADFSEDNPEYHVK